MKPYIPLAYYGSKSNLAPHLIQRFPDHDCFVDVFGGGGSVLFSKPRSKNEVYNDLNNDVVNLMRQMRDHNSELKALLEMTPYSREELKFCLENKDPCSDLEKARRYFSVLRMSYGAIANSSSFGANATKQQAQVFRNKVDRLEEAAQRLRGVIIENLPFQKIIKNYDRPETFFYCDPPYVPSTRSSGGSVGKYRHEMTIDDHKELIEQLRGIKGKVMISGYNNDLYEREFRDWKKWSKEMQCVSACQKKAVYRNENIWMNYDLKEVEEIGVEEIFP